MRIVCRSVRWAVLSKLQNESDTLREVVVYQLLVVLGAAMLFSFAEGLSFWEALYWGRYDDHHDRVW